MTMNVSTASPVRLELYHTAIPMRRFEHAAATRNLAEAVVVRMEFSDGTTGWGEALPREYVTGETIDSVVRDLSEVIWPTFLAEAAEAAVTGRVGLPATGQGGPPRPEGNSINAAACAFDLAGIDRILDHTAEIAPDVLKQIFGGERPRDRIDARVSGVLGSADPAQTGRRLRLMRWFGLRDFKLKLGFGDAVDAENLHVVVKQIGRAVEKGKCTLRVDVNGGWGGDEAPERIAELASRGICVVEQPVRGSAAELVELARRCRLPLMADESLLTDADARVLLEEPRRIWWNIRLSKNGGFIHSLGLARLASARGVPFVLGCMVGESSILSAAQRRCLEWGPSPRFVEGNYGRFLLADDLTRKSLRFGYGGRLKALRGAGLGVSVDPEKLARYGKLVRTLTA